MIPNYYQKAYTEQIKALDKIIERMQADLQQYEQKNGKTRYGYFKQQQIKILINISLELNEITQTLINDPIFTADNTIFKLEGICLLHGVGDLNYWYSLPTNYIANTVKQAYAENWRQTPFDLTPGNLAEIEKPIKTSTKPILNWANFDLKQNKAPTF